MKLIKNKYSILILSMLIGLITWYSFFSGYKDWSKLNDLVEKECAINGKVKETCIVDFHKLDFTWDNIYYFEAGEQGGLDNILDKKNMVVVRPGGIYFIFLKNKKLAKVFEHYYDVWGDLAPDWNNNILLVPNWEEKRTQTHCKNDFILKRIYNYENSEENNHRIVYGFQCLN